MSLLSTLWEHHLSSLLNDSWHSLYLWRTATLLLFTLIIMAVTFRNRILSFINKPESIQHDKDIFIKSNNIMSERQFLDLLDELYGYDSYHRNNWHPLYYFMRYFEESSNSYILQKIEKNKIKLLKTIAELYSFVPFHFSPYHRNQQDDNTKYCLHPEYNFDQEGDHTRETAIKYITFQKELHKKVVVARKAYNDYRTYIKNNLKI